MRDGGGTVLVGWDDGTRSREALALGLVLARECGFDLRVVHCHPGPESSGSALDEVPEEALSAGAAVDLVVAASASEGLQEEARRIGAETIVIGSTHRGSLGRIVPGSVAERLLHGAPCAVTVAPVGYGEVGASSIRMIAVAFDGSDESRGAADEAVRLAQAARAGLKLISVVPRAQFGLAGLAASHEQLHAADKEYRRTALTELAESLPAEVRPAERLRDGDPAVEILAECQSGVDLLLLGSRGKGPLRRVMLGSVSTRVVRSAPCPVMIVPRSARADRVEGQSSMAG